MKKLLYGLIWRVCFRGKDADPNDPQDRSKGFKKTYLYSLRDNFGRFAENEAVHFEEKK